MSLDPLGRQEAVLAALDEQIALVQLAESGLPSPLELIPTTTLYMNGHRVFTIRAGGEPGVKAQITSFPADAESMVMLRNDAIKQLEGRRRIIQRHAPKRAKVNSEWIWVCSHDGYKWEDCPDWLDATAGLEER